ncbi:MAG TPA: protease inhibitor I42 family protein [Ktedonobacteraceae bacterium]|jgi:predicted secreted protein
MSILLFNRSHHDSLQIVRVGDTIEIQLTERPTGYLWGSESVSNANVVFQQKRVVCAADPAPGASMTMGFLFLACKAGSSTIELKRQRPWEQQSAGQDTRFTAGEQRFRLILEIRPAPSAL